MINHSLTSSIRVNYYLRIENADSSARQHYDIRYQLQPYAKARPFEPFLTLLRESYLATPEELIRLLEKTCLTVRLRALILAWILGEPTCENEPPNPIEYQFEQASIRQALYEILQLAFSECSLRILIEHAEYLPVSSSQLLQEINSATRAGLVVDLLLQPEALKNWWPEDAIERQLKHRFLTAGQAIGADQVADKTVVVGKQIDETKSGLYWAAKLYCGHELKQLMTESMLNVQDASIEDRVLRLCQSIQAATFTNHAEEVSRLSSTLNKALEHRVSPKTQAFIFETQFMSAIWFHRNRKALRLSQSYMAWSKQQGTFKQQVYSHYLQTIASCLAGRFQHSDDHGLLEQQLNQLSWYDLFHEMRSLYWYDHDYMSHNAQQLIHYCNAALEWAKQQSNQHALTRAAHYLSIVLRHQGALSQSLDYIDKTIDMSLQLFDRSGTYNALNSKAYLLGIMGHFESALSAVESAFALVRDDSNEEQICTTLYNAAFIAVLSGHSAATIRLVDDIFSIMQLRGLTQTRFRSTYDMRTLQALAILFEGDYQLANAVYQVSPPEAVRTRESELFHQLMTRVAQAGRQDPTTLLSAFDDLYEQTCSQQQPALSLFVLRVQVCLSEQLFDADHPMTLSTKDKISKLGHEDDIASAWPNDDGTANAPMSHRFEGLKAIQVAQRESQVDLLRMENALLNIALELEARSASCRSLEELFRQCQSALQKQPHILWSDIQRGSASARDLDTRSGYPRHHFPFRCGQEQAWLTVEFDATTEAYQDQLLQWMDRLTDQLERSADLLRQRQESEQLAYRDHLTGLKNRAAFDRFFSTYRLQAGQVMTVAFIDLNRFKSINDQHGHHTGDAILGAFAQHLQSSIRTSDNAFRIGGDEFFVVFWDARSEDIADGFQDSLNSFFNRERRAQDPYKDLYPRISCSVGMLEVIARSNAPLDQQSIVNEADALMYRAKGRNRLLECGQLTLT